MARVVLERGESRRGYWDAWVASISVRLKMLPIFMPERASAMSRLYAQLHTRTLTLLVVVIGTCCLGGCSDDNSGDHPFTVPGGEAGTPVQTWQVIQQSLNDHRVNSWTGSIGATFEYLPDPVSEAKYPGSFSQWGLDEELAFARALFSADLDFDAQLVVNDSQCPAMQGSTHSWPGVEYSVVVAGVNGDSPVTYRGVADLEFELEGRFWYLTRWADLRGAAAPWNANVVCPTLGELRAAYSAR